MKIYTRKGDSGHTSLIDGDIVNKHNLSVDAYGTIDELNSFLGLLKDYVKDDKIKDILNKIQIKLFSIGSILASGKNKNISEKVKIEKKDVEFIELEIDRLNKDLPDPDLLIRTGGEMRLSNFLLWDLAYTELMFVPQLWPDFDKLILENCISDYSKRIRKYGGDN